MGRHKGITLTERDRDVLKSILRYRVLTLNQIHRRFFGGRVQYHQKRLSQLVEEGYLRVEYLGAEPGTRNSCSGSGREANCYVLTGRGMRVATEGDEDESYRRAHDNAPENKFQLRRLVDINEIFVRLYEYGMDDWQWLSSREVKKQWHVPAKFQWAAGGLQRGEQEMLIWYLAPLPEGKRPKRKRIEQDGEDTIEIFEGDPVRNTFRQIADTAQKSLVLDVAVLCKDWDTWQNTVQGYLNLPLQQRPGVRSLHILHITHLDYLLAHLNGWLKKPAEGLLEKALRPPRSAEVHARYVTEDEQNFVVDATTGDIIHLLHAENRIANPNTREREGVIVAHHPNYLGILSPAVLDRARVEVLSERPQPEQTTRQRPLRQAQRANAEPSKRVAFGIPESERNRLYDLARQADTSPTELLRTITRTFLREQG
ncbi:hypothetical protein GTO91_15850 [Heliobacterium undosum]|uniref:Replication-relaxation n=1 Tax=Heliomicrobium undosum TaxID=121734 RepID=A0A845LE38_9FIRM|nr:replication-relaxation family protein [Heliomicrobium undosum]MZP31181.1 hypothetical protein [Heliomicrobium undosum]